MAKQIYFEDVDVGTEIGPLENLPIIKDLATDMTGFFEKWRDAGGAFVPTKTRHGFTICKVVDVDLEIDQLGRQFAVARPGREDRRIRANAG